MNQALVEHHVQCILEQLEPMREGLKDTPRRVRKAYEEYFKGYNQSPEEILSAIFNVDDVEKGLQYDEMIVLRDINFFSTCEHHMAPFYGTVHVGYIPGENNRVVGVSKLARLVECFSRRLQIQERMTSQIGKALEQALDPLGVIVVAQGKHLCMGARGIQKPEASMVTSYCTGVFRNNELRSRQEFMDLIRI